MRLVNVYRAAIDIKIRYVIVNIIIAAITFGRNLAFMRMLGLSELGQVALAQTIIMLISFLQFGLINGGYRIYTSRDRQENEKVNNLIMTYIGLLAAVVVIVCLSGVHPFFRMGILPKTLYFGLAAGIATLTANWMNNCLIADEKLGMSNLINLLSTMASFALVIMPGHRNVQYALWSLLLQPLAVVGATLAFHEFARPTRIWVAGLTLRNILALGFVPFAGGILALLGLQLERWSIVSVLGTEQLGRFYIIILYSSIFTLVPASLLNIYYPNAMRKYEEGDIEALLLILKQHSKDLFRYILFAIVVTMLFMKWTVTLFLPKFQDTVYFVYIALPGFIATSLCDVLALYYNAVKRLKQLLWYGLFGLCSYAICLELAYKSGSFSLVTVVVARSFSAVLASTILYIMYYRDIHGRRARV